MKRYKKYSKAMWAAGVGAVATILEWQPGWDIPAGVQAAVTLLFVFFVGNENEIVEE